MDCEKVRKRHQQRSVAMALLLGLSSLSPSAFGGGVTDGSVGRVQSLSGNFTVPQSLGSLRGNNLFHSFARFSIDAGESATFTTTTGSIQNVLSRITGGEASRIHGLLRLHAASGSRPEFYLINPAGVIFGAGAQVDVPAGLYVSTAQRLRFADGFAWDTTAPTVSALTVASPEAFGFVGSQSPASVLLHNKDAAGNRQDSAPDIRLKAGSTFSITAGAVQFDSGRPHTPNSVSDPVPTVSVSEGGQIRIKASGDVSILNGGLISSSTSSDKAAGSIVIEAASLLTDRGEFREGRPVYDDTGIVSRTRSAKDAGQIRVKVTGPLTIVGGTISSETRSTGSAGAIDVEAGEMTIDGLGFALGISNDARTNSMGQANSGRIHVKVAGQLSLLDGGQISSSTVTPKVAGSVDVEARTLRIDSPEHKQATGIFSVAERTRRGRADAGRIKVIVADELSIFNGGEISSDSNSAAAGAIDVQAGSVEIAGFKIGDDGLRPSRITSRARPDSSGQSGNVSVTTDRLELSNSGSISIENLATLDATAVAPGTITVRSGDIFIGSGGNITAASSGNVAASNIEVDFADLLVLRDAAITTTAQRGNGGTITINGAGGVLLDHSQVTTSVKQNGNAGNITIKASTLALDTGFIQANTEAPLATGGNVLVDVDSLVPSGNTLALAGDIPFSFQRDVFGFNVIQAAAPAGVSGTVDVTSPALDIAGSLAGLSAELIAFGVLGKDLCRVGAGSSFTPVGRGGLRASASGMIRPEGAFGLAQVGAGGLHWHVAESSEAALEHLGATTTAACR